jgi:hypothetical protein
VVHLVDLEVGLELAIEVVADETAAAEAHGPDEE